MAYRDLRQGIEEFETLGELVRIKAEVDWEEEIGAIAEEAIRADKGALLFENIRDHQQTQGRRLFINSHDTERRVAISLGLPPLTPPLEIVREVRSLVRSPIQPVRVATGPCKEQVERGDEVNLYEFPAPKLHSKDGGRYLQTYGGVVTRDPETGWQNIGIYRGMIVDACSLSLLWIPSQHWGFHGRKYRDLGRPMPIAITVGSSAIAPLAFFSYAPVGTCEYDLVGALAREPVPLVRCESVDLEVPASSEIVLEGEMWLDPATFKPEGPFGEYPGYYTSVWAEPRPVMQVKVVTHRHDPILDCRIPGMTPHHPRPQHHLVSSALIWNRLEDTGVQGITGVYVEPAQPAFIYISLNKLFYGHAKQVGTALWGCGYNWAGKYVIVTDSDVDITNAAKVLAAVANRTQGLKDFVVCQGSFGGGLDPGIHPDVKRKTGGVSSWDRILVDATWPWEWEPRDEWGGLKHPPPCQAEAGMVQRVHQRWQEYGF